MFLDKLKTKKITKGWYQLKEPLRYDIYTVPVGFKTDLATIPKSLQWLYKPNGKYARASVLHDYLYDTDLVSRKKADEIFYYAMLSDGVKLITADIFYFAVRLFGWKYKK